MLRTDLCVVGASYAGLTCAAAAAAQGLHVTLLESKPEIGYRPHTTGILVQEAIAQLPEIPSDLVRPIRGVRMYAPSLRSFDLFSNGYAFWAADTTALLQWMAADVVRRGRVELKTQSRFIGAVECAEGWCLPSHGIVARYLVGADGARSTVAKHFGLGRNSQFLVGMELEFAGNTHVDDRFLHVLVDSDLAPGYIAWVVPGVGVTQVGLACRHPGHLEVERLLEKLKPLFDFSSLQPLGRRGGLIPVGGVVSPMSGHGVALVGDAAGMVSPLTAGGIHKSLQLGRFMGEAVAQYLHNQQPDPGHVLAEVAPRYRAKKILRTVINCGVPNSVIEGVFDSALFKRFAQQVFFHHSGLLSAQGWKALLGMGQKEE